MTRRRTTTPAPPPRSGVEIWQDLNALKQEYHLAMLREGGTHWECCGIKWSHQAAADPS